MQSFNQQPAEKKEQQAAQGAGEVEDAEPFPPLYEYPPDVPAAPLQDSLQHSPAAPVLTGVENLQPPSEEDIRRGLVYPPPPSFYQNMQVPLQRHPLPPQQVAYAPVPYNNYAPQRQAFTPGAGVQAPPFPPPQFPLAQPPVKRSRKWVWIIVSIFGAALLIVCGLCSWAFYDLFNTTFQQVSGATNIVHEYYRHVQRQEYAAAYQDLQVSGLSLTDFTQQAQNSDTQNGLLQSFTVEQPSFSTDPNSGGPDLSTWRVTADVTREKTAYPVLLTVHEIGNAWKITYFDKV